MVARDIALAEATQQANRDKAGQGFRFFCPPGQERRITFLDGTLRPDGRLLLVNFSKDSEKLIWWERLYQLTPTFLVPWLFAGCRPIQAAPFVRAAGFVEVEREYLAGGFNSEIITARK